MRDIFFYELRECNRVINSVTDVYEQEAGNKKLVEIMETIYSLSSKARQEGLLELEIFIDNFEDVFNVNFLKQMVMLIVDGTEPDLLEEISTAKYFSANLSGYEALHYLLMLFGCLAIQAGENPLAIEKKMFALVPNELEEMYCKKKNEQAEMKDNKSDECNEDILEKYYSGEIAVDTNSSCYFLVKITDYAIKALDDLSIQRVLRDTDNQTLTIAMKGLTGMARRRLLTNLSRRLAIMIVNDMEFFGAIRVADFADAVMKLFSVIVKLINTGEISCLEGEVFCQFAKIFNLTEGDSIQAIEKKEAENELYNLMKEYHATTCQWIK